MDCSFTLSSADVFLPLLHSFGGGKKSYGVSRGSEDCLCFRFLFDSIFITSLFWIDRWAGVFYGNRIGGWLGYTWRMGQNWSDRASGVL
jgi:hypothetical protein